MDQLKVNAEKGRVLYNSGQISREEAKDLIMPYINTFNEKTIEIAKNYGMKPKKISFGQYIR
jgi:hypothetical protein